jgi:hypothetical protein
MALVIAMVLMGFILLLLISLSVQLQVEMHAASISTRQLDARANALLGLSQALGELQAAAGPDQRVTATAGILDDTRDENRYWTGVWNVEGDNPFDYAGGIRDGAGRIDESERPPVWLISSNNAPDPRATIESVNVVDGEVQTVRLLGENTFTPQAPSDPGEIIAGRVRVEEPGGKIGGYAWWVGDEGVKAKLNLVDRTGELDAGTVDERRQRDRMPLVTSQRAAGELLLDAGANYPVNAAKLEKVGSGTELSWLSNEALNADWVKESFHDVTFASAGVLSDTRHGGLKKDLSRGLGDQWQTFMQELQSDSTQWSNGWPRPQSVFQVPGPGGLYGAPYDGSLYGPYWDVLYHYANLYQPYQPWIPNLHDAGTSMTFRGYMSGEDGPAGLDGLGAGDADIEVRGMGPDDQNFLPRHDFINDTSKWMRGNWFALPPTLHASNTYDLGDSARRDPVWNTLAPVLARLQIVFSLSSIEIADPATGLPVIDPTTGGKSYRLHLHMSPAVVLWNPYNATLAATRYSFNFEPIVRLQIKVDGVNYLTGPANGKYNLIDLLKANAWGSSIKTDDGTAFANLGSDGYKQAMLLETQPVTLAPGEVRVFSLPSSDIPWHPLMTKGSQNSNYWLSNQFNPTNFAYVELLKTSQNGSFINYNSSTPNPTTDLPEIKVDAGHPGDITVTFFAESIGTQYGNNGFLTAEGIDLNTEPNHFTNNTPIRMGGGLRYARFVTSDTSYSLGTVENLVGNPVPFAAIYAALKTTQESTDGVPVFSQFNARAIVSNKLIGNPDMPFTEIYRGGLLDASDSQLDIEDSGGLSFYGPSYETQNGGQSRLILFDVPRQPLLSVGELMHANVSYYDILPQYAVGNSYASPYIPAGDYYATWDQDSGSHFPVVDYSYALNDALFDEYFFSGVPARYSRYGSAELASMAGQLPPYEDFDEDYLSAGKPLPNPRMLPRQASTWAETLERIQDLDTAAAQLMVDGAFNVNSTSVEAWKAVLGSLALAPGETYPLASYTGGNSSISANSMDYPAPRFSLPVDDPGRRWTGFATLSEGEVETLAENIVEEVKARGPFLSLSDFVNRRLTNGDAGRAGALQAAIDHSGINSTADLGPSYNVSASTSSPYRRMDAANLAPAQGAGVAGWLLQNDILRGLAPVLTARSDTFRIRAYGDVESAVSGEIESRVWLEAIVQRMPEYVDASDAPETPVSLIDPGEPVRPENPALSDINRQFGRKFKIVAFRWLSEDEI